MLTNALALPDAKSDPRPCSILVWCALPGVHDILDRQYVGKGGSKKLHDPLAFSALLDEGVCSLVEVTVESRIGDTGHEWGSRLCQGTGTFAAVDYDHDRFVAVILAEAEEAEVAEVAEEAKAEEPAVEEAENEEHDAAKEAKAGGEDKAAEGEEEEHDAAAEPAGEE